MQNKLFPIGVLSRLRRLALVPSGLSQASNLRKGVAFASEYADFVKKQVAPFIQREKSKNIEGLEFSFIVSGKVKNCGLEEVLSNLFFMISKYKKDEIKVSDHPQDPRAVCVTAKTDFFSFSLFLGLILPVSSVVPRVYHGVVSGENGKDVLINIGEKAPLGEGIFNVKIEKISSLQIDSVYNGIKKPAPEAPRATKEAGRDLGKSSFSFISGLI